MCYLCPLCALPLPLQSDGKHYACAQRHHFDIAQAGYVNLLPVQHKHSLAPGDNKPMLTARRAFLAAGYYARLTQAIVELFAAHLPLAPTVQLLDLGCGEGYYSRALASALATPFKLSLHGLDIAKVAIALAAKQQPDVRFVVASVKRLPYPVNFFDGVLRVFAPLHLPELERVLKPGGLFLSVTPGARHLWQLKTFIYQHPQEHTPEPLPAGFTQLANERVQYSIDPNPTERIALLQMTPFAWRANVAVQQAIQALETLPIDVDFQLTLLQKTA